MNFAEPFIRRPVATTLLVLTILIFGIMGYRLLPVSDLPTVDYPTIQVGAEPARRQPRDDGVVRGHAAREAVLDDRRRRRRSARATRQGSTNITLQFDLSRNIDAAAQDVQSMIARTRASLPPGMPSPPSYQKVNPADSADSLPHARARRRCRSRRSTSTPEHGARPAPVDGQRRRAGQRLRRAEVRRPHRRRSDAAGGAPDRHRPGRRRRLPRANVNRPTGTLYGPDRNFVVQASGQLMDARGVPADRRRVSQRQPGAPRAKSRTSTTASRTRGTRAGSTARPPSTSPSSGSRAPTPSRSSTPSRRCCRSCRRSCRPRCSSAFAAIASVSIRESVHDVKFTLLLTVVLVVLVIFLFLRNLSATIIPSLALPFSIVGTFAVMWVLGYSLDNLSLMALTLSVGFVVDDAIVMLENIVRHMEMGKTRMQAALDGSKEIAFTIVSMTLSLAAVFIPILFMGGIVGRLMHEFAVTIAACDSGVGPGVAHADADAVQPVPEAAAPMRHGRLYNAIETRVRRAGCAGTAGRCPRRSGSRRSTMVVSALLLVGHRLLLQIMPKGFIPSVDTGPAERPDRDGPGYRFRVDGRSTSKRSWTSCAKDPNVAGVHRQRRRSGRRPARTSI